jgi:two-component system chemotaxis sensor kinase CheA
MNDRFRPPANALGPVWADAQEQALRQAFFDEAADNLAHFEQLLLGGGFTQADDETLHALFRCAHSVKGGAAAFALDDVTELTHRVEALLDRLRRHERRADASLLELLLHCGDALRGLLEHHRGAAGGATAPPALEGLLQALREQADATPPSAAAPERALQLTVGPLQDPGVLGELVGLFSEIDGLGQITPLAADPSCGGAGDGLHRFALRTHCSDDELLSLCGFHVDAALLRLSPLAAAAAATEPPHAAAEPSGALCAAVAPRATPAPAADGDSLRVPVRKVDELINLAGELVTAQAMLAQGCAALAPPEQLRLAGVLAELQRHTRALQEAAMAVRMIPVAQLFGRFARLVRELGAKLGKPIELLTEGGSTELDKGMIERIVDPLTHLVRNSCDHGIEPPAERRARGKPETGRLWLAASHQGGSIVIELRDDGRGLSRARLLATARERGLRAPDSLSDAEVWSLIFAAGFSTAAQVSEVSGRGVGMDVVQRNIAALGGAIDLDSVEGQGLCVRVRLPLTLAIMDALAVRVADERYLLPLAAVVESLHIAPQHPLGSDAPQPPCMTPAALGSGQGQGQRRGQARAALRTLGGGAQLLRLGDDFVPVLALQQLFAVPAGAHERDDSVIVVVEADGARVALRVHELLGQQQVVVKNLEPNLGAIERVAGATIMGDGRVALILDVRALVRAAAR